MTEPTDDPDWSLLPDDPVGFFGFTETFDLKDLKRRYNQLIKRFKPEKCPDEFQRIRAAYELLAHSLPYQSWESPPTEVRVVRAEDVDDPAAELPGGSRSSAFPADDPYEIVYQSQPAGFDAPVATLSKRVRETPPETLLHELQATTGRTPAEQLLLAFLQDALEPELSYEFLDGLLLAVRTARDDSAWVLLREYLHSDEARGRCREYLERIFSALASDEVFSLTEPLWDELQSRVKFPEFLELWQKCLRHVSDHRLIGRVLFEIRLLQRTLFYAPAEWTAQQLALLAKGDVDWPAWLDPQIYHLEHLAEYARYRSQFLRNGNPLRAKLDDVIRAYCVEAPDFDQRFLDLQSELVRDFGALSAAFPVKISTFPKVWNAWNLMCDQVAHRFPHATSDSDARNLAQQKLRALPDSLKWHSMPLLTSPRNWKWWTWLLATASLIGIPLFFFTAFYLNNFLAGLGPAIGMGVFGLIVGSATYGAIACVDVAPTSGLAWDCYTMGMRRQLVLFLQRTPLPAATIYAALRTFQLDSARANHLLGQIERDYALRFYANAVWFLR